MKVIVCDKCLRASCWYGEFMCEDGASAGLGVLSVDTLASLNREHADYWQPEYFLKVYGACTPDVAGHPDLEAIARQED